MELGHHGRHRRRRVRRRFLAVGLGVVAVAAVAVLVWWTAGGPARDPSASGSAAPTRSAPAPESSRGERTATASATSATPVASSATPRLGATLRLGGTPQYVQVAPDGTFAYVADPASGTVFRIDTRTDQVAARIRIPQGPPQLLSFSADGRQAYVSVFTSDFRANFVDFIDTATDTVTAAVPVDQGPYAVTPSPDGREVYVPLYQVPKFDVIDIATHKVTARVPGAANPHWFA